MARKQRRHTQLTRRAAGSGGTTEKRQRGGTRLDAKRPGKPPTAIEIERSGRIRPALNRLGKEKQAKKVLKVPQKDLDRAVDIAREIEMTVTLTNLSGTKKRFVKR